jgi:hypothetical protein
MVVLPVPPLPLRVATVCMFHPAFNHVKELKESTLILRFLADQHFAAGVCFRNSSVFKNLDQNLNLSGPAEFLDTVITDVGPVEKDRMWQPQLAKHRHGEFEIIQPERSGFGHQQHEVAAFYGLDDRAGSAGGSVDDGDT